MTAVKSCQSHTALHLDFGSGEPFPTHGWGKKNVVNAEREGEGELLGSTKDVIEIKDWYHVFCTVLRWH